jgi:hypothetical protein
MTNPTQSEPGPQNGYVGARYLRDTPYKSISEWSRAILDAIPEDERCGVCEGRGLTVIYASNGGASEFPRCWACGGSRRKAASS